MNKQRIFLVLRWFLGLAILGFLFWQVNDAGIRDHFSGIRWGYVFIAAPVIALGFAIGAKGQQLLIAPIHKITYWQWLRVFWLGWAVGLLVPGQVGDVAALSIWLKKQGIDLRVSVSRILVDKLISLVFVLSWAIVGLSLYILPEWKVWVVPAGIILLALTIGMIWGTGSGVHLSILNRLFGYKFEKTEHVPLRLLFLNANCTFLKMMIFALGYMLVFRAIAFQGVSYWEILSLVSLVSLLAYLPVSVNGLGVVELGAVPVFAKVGVLDHHVLLAFVMLRIVVWVLVLVPSAIILLSARTRVSN